YPFQNPEQSLQHQGYPFQSPEHPLQHQGYPFQNPEQSLQHQGYPFQCPEDPLQHQGYPFQNPEQSLQHQGYPFQCPEDPLQHQGYPFQNPEQSLQHQGYPFQCPEDPLQHQGYPFQNPEQSLQHQGYPFQCSEDPFQNPEQSLQHQGYPFQSPEQSLQRPEHPFQHPEQSLQRPEHPLQHPEQSLQQQGKSSEHSEESHQHLIATHERNTETQQHSIDIQQLDKETNDSVESTEEHPKDISEWIMQMCEYAKNTEKCNMDIKNCMDRIKEYTEKEKNNMLQNKGNNSTKEFFYNNNQQDNDSYSDSVSNTSCNETNTGNTEIEQFVDTTLERFRILEDLSILLKTCSQELKDAMERKHGPSGSSLERVNKMYEYYFEVNSYVTVIRQNTHFVRMYMKNVVKYHNEISVNSLTAIDLSKDIQLDSMKIKKLDEEEYIIMKNEFATFEQESVVVEQESVVVEQESAVVAQESVVVEQESAVVEQESAVVAQESDVVEQESAVVAQESDVVEQESAVVAQESDVVEQESDVVEQECIKDSKEPKDSRKPKNKDEPKDPNKSNDASESEDSNKSNTDNNKRGKSTDKLPNDLMDCVKDLMKCSDDIMKHAKELLKCTKETLSYCLETHECAKDTQECSITHMPNSTVVSVAKSTVDYTISIQAYINIVHSYLCNRCKIVSIIQDLSNDEKTLPKNIYNYADYIRRCANDMQLYSLDIHRYNRHLHRHSWDIEIHVKDIVMYFLYEDTRPQDIKKRDIDESEKCTMEIKNRAMEVKRCTIDIRDRVENIRARAEKTEIFAIDINERLEKLKKCGENIADKSEDSSDSENDDNNEESDKSENDDKKGRKDKKGENQDKKGENQDKKGGKQDKEDGNKDRNEVNKFKNKNKYHNQRIRDHKNEITNHKAKESQDKIEVEKEKNEEKQHNKRIRHRKKNAYHKNESIHHKIEESKAKIEESKDKIEVEKGKNEEKQHNKRIRHRKKKGKHHKNEGSQNKYKHADMQQLRKGTDKHSEIEDEMKNDLTLNSFEEGNDRFYGDSSLNKLTHKTRKIKSVVISKCEYKDNVSCMDSSYSNMTLNRQDDASIVRNLSEVILRKEEELSKKCELREKDGMNNRLDLNVHGTLTVRSNLSENVDLTVRSNLSENVDLTVRSNLSENADLTVRSNLSENADLTVRSNLSDSGDLTVRSDLSDSGYLNIHGDACVHDVEVEVESDLHIEKRIFGKKEKLINKSSCKNDVDVISRTQFQHMGSRDMYSREVLSREYLYLPKICEQKFMEVEMFIQGRDNRNSPYEKDDRKDKDVMCTDINDDIMVSDHSIKSEFLNEHNNFSLHEKEQKEKILKNKKKRKNTESDVESNEDDENEEEILDDMLKTSFEMVYQSNNTNKKSKYQKIKDGDICVGKKGSNKMDMEVAVMERHSSILINRGIKTKKCVDYSLYNTYAKSSFLQCAEQADNHFIGNYLDRYNDENFFHLRQKIKLCLSRTFANLRTTSETCVLHFTNLIFDLYVSRFNSKNEIIDSIVGDIVIEDKQFSEVMLQLLKEFYPQIYTDYMYREQLKVKYNVLYNELKESCDLIYHFIAIICLFISQKYYNYRLISIDLIAKTYCKSHLEGLRKVYSLNNELIKDASPDYYSATQYLDSTFSPHSVNKCFALEVEICILKKLNYDLSIPTAYSLLDSLLKANENINFLKVRNDYNSTEGEILLRIASIDNVFLKYKASTLSMAIYEILNFNICKDKMQRELFDFSKLTHFHNFKTDLDSNGKNVQAQNEIKEKEKRNELKFIKRQARSLIIAEEEDRFITASKYINEKGKLYLFIKKLIFILCSIIKKDVPKGYYKSGYESSARLNTSIRAFHKGRKLYFGFRRLRKRGKSQQAQIEQIEQADKKMQVPQTEETKKEIVQKESVQDSSQSSENVKNLIQKHEGEKDIEMETKSNKKKDSKNNHSVVGTEILNKKKKGMSGENISINRKRTQHENFAVFVKRDEAKLHSQRNKIVKKIQTYIKRLDEIRYDDIPIQYCTPYILEGGELKVYIKKCIQKEPSTPNEISDMDGVITVRDEHNVIDEHSDNLFIAANPSENGSNAQKKSKNSYVIGTRTKSTDEHLVFYYNYVSKLKNRLQVGLSYFLWRTKKIKKQRVSVSLTNLSYLVKKNGQRKKKEVIKKKKCIPLYEQLLNEIKIFFMWVYKMTNIEIRPLICFTDLKYISAIESYERHYEKYVIKNFTFTKHKTEVGKKKKGTSKHVSVKNPSIIGTSSTTISPTEENSHASNSHGITHAVKMEKIAIAGKTSKNNSLEKKQKNFSKAYIEEVKRAINSKETNFSPFLKNSSSVKRVKGENEVEAKEIKATNVSTNYNKVVAQAGEENAPKTKQWEMEMTKGNGKCVSKNKQNNLSSPNEKYSQIQNKANFYEENEQIYKKVQVEVTKCGKKKKKIAHQGIIQQQGDGKKEQAIDREDFQNDSLQRKKEYESLEKEKPQFDDHVENDNNTCVKIETNNNNSNGNHLFCSSNLENLPKTSTDWITINDPQVDECARELMECFLKWKNKNYISKNWTFNEYPNCKEYYFSLVFGDLKSSETLKGIIEMMHMKYNHLLNIYKEINVQNSLGDYD
ncbi:cyclin, putative, partial [Plasmodium ovale curtisi]